MPLRTNGDIGNPGLARVVADPDLEPGQRRERGPERGRDRTPTLRASSVVREEETQRRQQPNDLFLANLAGTADAVMRQSRQRALVDEAWRRIELLDEHVEVKVLQNGGGDEISPSRENAGGLWSADRLASAEGDERRTLSNEAAQ